MDGRAIGGAAIGDAGLRRLASEMDGPRPGGVERVGVGGVPAEARGCEVSGDPRTVRPAGS